MNCFLKTKIIELLVQVTHGVILSRTGYGVYFNPLGPIKVATDTWSLICNCLALRSYRAFPSLLDRLISVSRQASSSQGLVRSCHMEIGSIGFLNCR